MIDEHCPQIEALDLFGFLPDNTSTGDVFRRLMPRLKKLSLGLERKRIVDLFVDQKTATIEMPKLTELMLREYCDFEELTDERLKQSLLGSPHIRRIEFKKFHICADVWELLPAYLPSCQELSFNGCHAHENAPDILTEWHKFKSLTALHIQSCYGFPTEQVLTSFAVNEVSLKNLSFVMPDYLRMNGSFVFEYITPLKQLETVTFGRSMPDIDIQRLASCLDKLMEINFDCYRITTNEIKQLLRRSDRTFELSIRIQTECLGSSDDPKNDCDEIAELLRARPAMKFKVEITERFFAVSVILRRNYSILATVLNVLFPHIHRFLTFSKTIRPNGLKENDEHGSTMLHLEYWRRCYAYGWMFISSATLLNQNRFFYLFGLTIHYFFYT